MQLKIHFIENMTAVQASNVVANRISAGEEVSRITLVALIATAQRETYLAMIAFVGPPSCSLLVSPRLMRCDEAWRLEEKLGRGARKDTVSEKAGENLL